jgi:hypothetical protein
VLDYVIGIQNLILASVNVIMCACCSQKIVDVEKIGLLILPLYMDKASLRFASIGSEEGKRKENELTSHDSGHALQRSRNTAGGVASQGLKFQIHSV